MHTLSLALQSYLDDDETAESKIKHSASEPVIKDPKAKVSSSVENDTTDVYDDDDDVWCNPEDEDNLEHRVKLDEEKEKHLREILGDETLEIVRQALNVSSRDFSKMLIRFYNLQGNDDETALDNISSMLPEGKRHLLDSKDIPALLATVMRTLTK